MRICYPCGDVFAPDNYTDCPRCARPLTPATARGRRLCVMRLARWIAGR